MKKTILLLLFLLASGSGLLARQRGQGVVIERKGVVLQGVFHMAKATAPRPMVVLLSGFPGGRTDVLGLGEMLAEAGIHVLTFQYSGTYESQGLANFDNQQKDIQAALDFVRCPGNILRFGIDTSQIILGGWCHGGGMALAYSVGHPEITSVFSLAGNDFGEFMREYFRNPQMKKIVDQMMDEMVENGVRFEKGGVPKEIAASGIENMNSIFDIRNNARELACKDILLVCAWDDELVTVDQFIFPLYKALKKENARNLQIIAFQDVHHFPNSRRQLAEQLAQWILSAGERK